MKIESYRNNHLAEVVRWVDSTTTIDRTFFENGQLDTQEYCQDARRHRDVNFGPAYIRWYENAQLKHQAYWLNGLWHHDLGPAYIWWHQNGRFYRQMYYQHGQLHRDIGPAVLCQYINGQLGDQEYWHHGKLMNYPTNDKTDHS